MPRWTLPSLIGLLSILGAVGVFDEDPLKRADKLFAEKSYKEALALYEEALPDLEANPTRDRVWRQRGLCLARLQRFDEAFVALEQAARDASDARGRALAWTELGVTSALAPGYYMEKEGKKTWGRWIQGGKYHWVSQENALRARRALVDAADLLEALLREAPDDAALLRAHQRAHLEGAAAIEVSLGSEKNWPPKRPEDLVGETAWPSRLLGVFDRAIAAATVAKDAGAEHLARYQQAQAVRRLVAMLPRVELVGDGGSYQLNDRGRTRVPLPDRFAPVAAFRATIAALSGAGLEDDARISLARVFEQSERWTESVATARELLEKHPDSDIKGDAQALIHRITRPRLQLRANPHRVNDGEPTLRVDSRNLGRVTLKAWVLDPRESLLRESVQRDGELDFDDTARLAENHGVRPEKGEELISLAHRTPDAGQHAWHRETLTLPLRRPGLYLVEARSEGMVWRDLLVVSDIALMQQSDGQRTLVQVVDARTGAPRADVPVVVRHRYRERGILGRRWRVRLVTGRSASDGTFVAPYPDGGNGRRISVIAGEGDRLALLRSRWASRRGADATSTRAYLVTDRPVYRPRDTARLAVVLRQQKAGSYSLLPSREFDLKIWDARGEEMLAQRVRTDDSGAFNASIELGDEPALGTYRVQVVSGKTSWGAGSFRVEEYRKPEFEVLVAAPRSAPRLGEGVSATISARTLTGVPVRGGRVSYRVFRERWTPSFPWEEPFQELYGAAASSYPATDRGRGRELVTEGTESLDDDGRLVIEWTSAAEDEDVSYLVQADVTDAANRTFNGQRAIPVTAARFAAGIRGMRRVVAAGEAIDLELMTRTPGGVAVASEGRIDVARVRQGEDGEIVLAEVASFSAGTDAAGRGVARWTPEEGGRYRFTYRTTDADGAAIVGVTRIWVHASGWTGSGSAMKDLELVLDRKVVAPGEDLRILVNAKRENAHVLLMLMAGSKMLTHRLLSLDGHTQSLAFPVEEGWAPNVHVVAWSLGEEGWRKAEAELLVPPASRLLDVDVALDASSYEPGAIGRATVTVRDQNGDPVAARVLLGCLDAAILKIAPDQVPDIRRAFYGQRRSYYLSGSASDRFDFDAYRVKGLDDPTFETRGWIPGWSVRPGMVTFLLDREGFGSEVAFEGLVAREQARTRSRGRRGAESGSLAADAAAPAASARATGSADLFLGEASQKKSMELEESLDDEGGRSLDSQGAWGQGEAEPEVRSDFRDTAVWLPDLVCDANGQLVAEIPFPESLTRWRTKAIAFTADTRVGTASALAVTRKAVMARLQAPRFVTEGDRIVISTLVDNLSGSDARGAIRLEVDGQALEILGEPEQAAIVQKDGQVRFDWTCRARSSGPVSLTTSLRTDRGGDAMKVGLPVQAWGSEKTLTASAMLDGSGARTFLLQVPEQRDPTASRLVVTASPSLSLTLLEALPYLIEYPYGCVEQTTSRFVPAVLCAKILNDAGTSLAAVLDGPSRRPLLGKQGVRKDPVSSDAALARVVEEGLERLASMQNGDGGWGWWGRQRSSTYMTAYVLSGLLLAREAEVKVSGKMIDRGVTWLASAVKTIERPQDAVFVSSVLARAGRGADAPLERLFAARDRLGIQGKALLMRALSAAGQSDRAQTVLRNLGDLVIEDEANGTVHWRPGGPSYWWWNAPVETNAVVLDAILDVAPQHEWATGLVRWLVANRSGSSWSNTKDTALAIQAMTRYAAKTGELDADYELVITAAGQERRFAVNRQTMFTADPRLVVEGADIAGGALEVDVRLEGTGRAWLTSALSVVSKEARIDAAAHQLTVRRSYWRVIEEPKDEVVDGRKVRKIVDRFELIDEGSSVAAGELIEVRLEIASANDFEYLLFEDYKPAGFEPLRTTSGSTWSRGISAHVEMRDERTAFFVSFLQQGDHKLSYRLRAEQAGTLRALPARGEAMYAPEYRGTSDSFLVRVTEPTGR